MNQTVIIMAVLAVLSGAFYWLTQNTNNNLKPEPIKIGAAMQITGRGATWGQNSRDGILLAAKKINQAGGIRGRQLEIIIEDTQTTTKGAVSAINKLITLDGVRFVLAGWSEQTEAIAPILLKNQVIGITVSAGAPGITKNNPYLFRVWPSDDLRSKILADFAIQRGWNYVTCVETIGTWETGVSEVFKQYLSQIGGIISINEKISPEDMDFRTLINKIQQSTSNVVYLAFNTNSTGPFIKQARQLGLSIPIMYINDLNDETIVNGADGMKNLEGVIYPVYQEPKKEFIKFFKAEYGRLPGVSADTAYDAVNILVNVLKKGISEDDIESVINLLLQVKNYDGVSGRISFDQDGDRQDANVIVMIVRDGGFTKFAN